MNNLQAKTQQGENFNIFQSKHQDGNKATYPLGDEGEVNKSV
jgi:hypothetical protein